MKPKKKEFREPETIVRFRSSGQMFLIIREKDYQRLLKAARRKRG
jgi:hypothetical protein